jgi:hypothetical protein
MLAIKLLFYVSDVTDADLRAREKPAAGGERCGRDRV